MDARRGSAWRSVGRRWRVRVVVSLFGGAATSLLIAWCAYLQGTSWFFRLPSAWSWPERMGWREEVRADVGVGAIVTETPLASHAAVRLAHGPPNIEGDRSMQEETAASMGAQVLNLGRIPAWSEGLVARHARRLPPGKRAYLMVQVQGWPVHCMRIWSAEIGDGRTATKSHGAAVNVPLSTGSSVLLPITPMPARFSASTAFWATPWLVASIAARAGRRWSRRRSGRCVACAYSLRGLENATPCPECGAAEER